MEERRAERRSALRAAGLELFGTQGFAAASITAVCRTSFVTTRYFYEEYGTLEALLLDVFDEQIGTLLEAITGPEIPPGPDRATREMRTRVEAFVDGISGDERAARIVLIESGSTALEERRRRARQGLIGYMAGRFLELIDVKEPGDRDFALLSLLMIGAVEGAMVDWVLTPPAERLDRAQIVDTMMKVFELVRVGYAN